MVFIVWHCPLVVCFAVFVLLRSLCALCRLLPVRFCVLCEVRCVVCSAWTVLRVVTFGSVLKVVRALSCFLFCMCV